MLLVHVQETMCLDAQIVTETAGNQQFVSFKEIFDLDNEVLDYFSKTSHQILTGFFGMGTFWVLQKILN